MISIAVFHHAWTSMSAWIYACILYLRTAVAPLRPQGPHMGPIGSKGPHGGAPPMGPMGPPGAPGGHGEPPRGLPRPGGTRGSGPRRFWKKSFFDLKKRPSVRPFDFSDFTLRCPICLPSHERTAASDMRDRIPAYEKILWLQKTIKKNKLKCGF